MPALLLQRCGPRMKTSEMKRSLEKRVAQIEKSTKMRVYTAMMEDRRATQGGEGSTTAGSRTSWQGH